MQFILSAIMPYLLFEDTKLFLLVFTVVRNLEIKIGNLFSNHIHRIIHSTYIYQEFHSPINQSVFSIYSSLIKSCKTFFSLTIKQTNDAIIILCPFHLWRQHNLRASYNNNNKKPIVHFIWLLLWHIDYVIRIYKNSD